MNILIISPYFAPFTGVGAYRMTSLARFLIQNGEIVTVIKAFDECYPDGMIDKSHKDDFISCFCFSMRKNDSSDFFSVIEKVCMSKHYDVCISTFGPFDYVEYLIAIIDEFKIPTIVDFRDLWLYEPRFPKTIKEFLIRIYEFIKYKPVENELLRKCAAFVTVTPKCVSIMERKYPKIKGKTFCIYNGYDSYSREESSFNNLLDRSKFSVCISGKMSDYSARGTKCFLKAVKKLISEGYDIQIIHVGKEENKTKILVKKENLPKGSFLEIGQVNYHTAQIIIDQADICAVIVNYKVGLGTKLFDYIGLNKPVVGYASKKSEIAAIIGQSNVCHSVKGFCECIKKYYYRDDIEKTTIDENRKAFFSRKTQNIEYYTIIKKITGGVVK